MSKQSNQDIIEFVRKTTEAITVMAEGNKRISENTGALKDLVTAQHQANIASFEEVNGKIDGLATMFKYVIIPLIAGILSLVGVKYLFKL